MIEDSFTIFDAVGKGASGALGVSLDFISSIPNLFFLLPLILLLAAFVLIVFVLGGKIKWIIRQYF